MGVSVTISADTIERAIQGLGKLDLGRAWNMLQSGDLGQELELGAEAADVISCFWPEAKYVEDALKLLIFIDALRKAGVWKPAEPTDPSMEHAAGPAGGTPTMHGKPEILPGGTENDPYAFDRR